MSRYEDRVADALDGLDDRELLMFVGMTLAAIRRTTDLLRWILIAVIALFALEVVILLIVGLVSVTTSSS
jgi:hypothetical protein